MCQEGKTRRANYKCYDLKQRKNEMGTNDTWIDLNYYSDDDKAN